LEQGLTDINQEIYVGHNKSRTVVDKIHLIQRGWPIIVRSIPYIEKHIPK